VKDRECVEDAVSFKWLSTSTLSWYGKGVGLLIENSCQQTKLRAASIFKGVPGRHQLSRRVEGTVKKRLRKQNVAGDRN
jgi:hypothetical protein